MWCKIQLNAVHFYIFFNHVLDTIYPEHNWFNDCGNLTGSSMLRERYLSEYDHLGLCFYEY